MLAAGMIVVIIGFILMSGSGSTDKVFNPDIFSFRRITLAPIVCLIGFVSMIFGVMYKPKDGDSSDVAKSDNNETVEEKQ